MSREEGEEEEVEVEVEVEEEEEKVWSLCPSSNRSGPSSRPSTMSYWRSNKPWKSCTPK